MLVAAGLLILASVLFPRPDDPTDYANFLALLDRHRGRTMFVLLAVPIGIWALAAGIGLVCRAIPMGRAAAVARLGFYGVLVGTAVVTVQFALSVAALAEGLDSAVRLPLWVAAIHVRSFSMTITWLGLAGVGLGIVTSRVYARWIGWMALGLGIGLGATSALSIGTGLNRPLIAITGGMAALTAVWAILAGVSVARSPKTGT
jgi:hypothetical protein